MDVNPKNSLDNNYDDLTAIKGIGQTRQQWLRDTFNVRTFRDLAALAADTIEARLKAEKQIPSRSHIERWLAEAKRFAENPGLLMMAKVKPAAKTDDWKPFASFVVEFQEQNQVSPAEVRTRVHYVEGDKTATWAGVDQQELWRWITQHLGDKAQPAVMETAPEKVTPFIEEPADTIAPTLSQPTAMGFGDQLQHMLARASQAGRSGGRRHRPSPIEIQPAMTPLDNHTPMVALGSASQPSKEYSDKLQQLIAKAKRLSSD